MKRKIVCDFKSVEQVEKMLPLKIYILTNFMLMSKRENCILLSLFDEKIFQVKFFPIILKSANNYAFLIP
jgi:hypothetical protein